MSVSVRPLLMRFSLIVCISVLPLHCFKGCSPPLHMGSELSTSGFRFFVNTTINIVTPPLPDPSCLEYHHVTSMTIDQKSIAQSSDNKLHTVTAIILACAQISSS